MRKRAYIHGIRSSLPDTFLSNEVLAEEYGDWSASKILKKTGIATRHIAAPNQCASDLGVDAARKLFETGLCAPGDIDFLIFCTQCPDHYLPATACLMQERLGLRTQCGALDINQGCSGFVYGLSLAVGLIESGQVDNVLLITGDTYSKFIHEGDRSVRTIFGDGAAATYIGSRDSEQPFIGPFVLGTDGKGANALIVPAGGLRSPVTRETSIQEEDENGNVRSANNLFMDGAGIFNFTLWCVPPLIDEQLEKSGLSMDEVDLFVFHQANKFMLDHLRKKIGVPEDRFVVDLEESGNIVSSTIPYALERCREQGRLRADMRIMIVGFGVGFSWGSTMLQFPAI